MMVRTCISNQEFSYYENKKNTTIDYKTVGKTLEDFLY